MHLTSLPGLLTNTQEERSCTGSGVGRKPHLTTSSPVTAMTARGTEGHFYFAPFLEWNCRRSWQDVRPFVTNSQFVLQGSSAITSICFRCVCSRWRWKRFWDAACQLLHTDEVWMCIYEWIWVFVIYKTEGKKHIFYYLNWTVNCFALQLDGN